jgi:formylglycine-generating enzyme required for sulfatase activity
VSARRTPARAVPLAIALALVALAAARARGAEPIGEEGEPEEPGSSAAAASSSLPPPSPHVEPKRGVIEQDGMIRLPGGSFSMGSVDSHAPPNERPAHVVKVKPFWIDRTEVSVGAYRACVMGGRCAVPARTSTKCTYPMDDPELPVSCVTWLDAEAFCRFQKKRLATEAEWEFAARGATGAAYPWGGRRTSCALAATLVRDTDYAHPCSGSRPARVGSHPSGATAYGVQDLSGNVEEWVSDYYAEHLAYVAPRAGSSRVLRGGGWLSAPSASRTTTRNWGSASEAGPNVGFRCARDVGHR